MIKDNIEFFNVSQITESGKLLRFDEDLINSLGCEVHQRGRFYAYRAIGSELRFKLDSKFFEITFLSEKEDTDVYIFYGDYMDKRYTLKAGLITTLHIEIPQEFLDNALRLPKGAFSPKVIRIVIGYSGYVSYLGIKTFGHEITPPSKDEVPSKTLLIYGSSISHGSESLEYINSYAFILSRLLKVNVLNKAIPGSAQAEKCMTDFLATLDFDASFVEFGVNVLKLYTKEEYQEHLDYLLSKLSFKPLNYTSVFMNGNMLDNDTIGSKRYHEFRSYANSLNIGKYINPDDLLTDFSALTADLLHPSDFGQLLIASNLAKLLKW